MSKKFYPEKEIENFLANREEYLKRKTSNLHFFSEKYKFPFGVKLATEINKQANCTFILIDSFDDYQSLFSELELYNEEASRERLRIIFVQFENRHRLPFYVKLCCQYFS